MKQFTTFAGIATCVAFAAAVEGGGIPVPTPPVWAMPLFVAVPLLCVAAWLWGVARDLEEVE